jgi:hypothetical protein
MKERFDYDALERISFSLNRRDRLIRTQNPAIYVEWEGASKEDVHGFVLHLEEREIHFVATLGITAVQDATHTKEENLEWIVTKIGTQSWKSKVRPYQFADPDERRLVCKLAVEALAIFPASYDPPTITRVSAHLSESLRRFADIAK